MDKPEYEPTKTYTVSGVKVCSEIAKDEDTAEYRAFHLRTSCPSVRWGTRTLGFSLTCYENPSSEPLMNTLEATRLQQAEEIVRIESGQIEETAPVFLGIQIQGPTGKAMNVIALPDLSLSVSLLSKDFIELLELRPLNIQTFQEQIISLPLFEATLSCGSLKTQSMVAASEHGSPALILGGDFFQKALKGNTRLITELIQSDDHRVLASAARCKKKFVLIAGKYGEQRPRLERIKRALATLNFQGLILDEYPDIEEQSLSEKMVTYASICRFVIVDDFVPSGHIDELGICRERKFVTAILRACGKPSTMMQADLADEILFMKDFGYVEDSQFEVTVLDAAKWADRAITERAMRLNRKLGERRGPNKVARA